MDCFSVSSVDGAGRRRDDVELSAMEVESQGQVNWIQRWLKKKRHESNAQIKGSICRVVEMAEKKVG